MARPVSCSSALWAQRSAGASVASLVIFSCCKARRGSITNTEYFQSRRPATQLHFEQSNDRVMNVPMAPRARASSRKRKAHGPFKRTKTWHSMLISRGYIDCGARRVDGVHVAHTCCANNLIRAVFESRKLPEARSHNDLRDSLIALGDRDRSGKRQLAKLHRWACHVSSRPKPFVTQDDNTSCALGLRVGDIGRSTLVSWHHAGTATTDGYLYCHLVFLTTENTPQTDCLLAGRRRT